MNFDWENWCRFCGNPGENIKCEIPIDTEYYFKVKSIHIRRFQEI